MNTRRDPKRPLRARSLRRTDGTRRDVTPLALGAVAVILGALTIAFSLREPGRSAAVPNGVTGSAAELALPFCSEAMIGTGTTCRTKRAVLTFWTPRSVATPGDMRLRVVRATDTDQSGEHDVRVVVSSRGADVQAALTGDDHRVYLAAAGQRYYPIDVARSRTASSHHVLRFRWSGDSLRSLSLCYVSAQPVETRRRIAVLPVEFD